VGGALLGGGLGTLLGGAAGAVTGTLARQIQKFRLRGAGSPETKKVVTELRSAIEAAQPVTEVGVDDLVAAANTARASAAGKGESFSLSDLPAFKDIARQAQKAITGRLSLPAITGEGLTAAEEAATSLPMFGAQKEVAAARFLAAMVRRVFGSTKEAERRVLTNELNRLLQSTNPVEQNKFLQSLIRAERVLDTPLGTRIPLAPAAAAGGAGAAAGGTAINPLLDQ